VRLEYDETRAKGVKTVSTHLSLYCQRQSLKFLSCHLRNGSGLSLTFLDAAGSREAASLRAAFAAQFALCGAVVPPFRFGRLFSIVLGLVVMLPPRPAPRSSFASPAAC
jgi:hypothetical protein